VPSEPAPEWTEVGAVEGGLTVRFLMRGWSWLLGFLAPLTEAASAGMDPTGEAGGGMDPTGLDG
jgi:hypothetical protein